MDIHPDAPLFCVLPCSQHLPTTQLSRFKTREPLWNPPSTSYHIKGQLLSFPPKHVTVFMVPMMESN